MTYFVFCKPNAYFNLASSSFSEFDFVAALRNHTMLSRLALWKVEVWTLQQVSTI